MKKIFVLLVAVVLVLSAVGVSQAALIGFDPSNQTVNLGDSASLDIVILGLNGDTVGSWDLLVMYDASIISFDSSINGDFLNGGDSTMSIFGPAGSGDNPASFFEVSLVFDPNDLVTSQPDLFVLATLMFNTVGIGTSNIGMQDLIFSNAFGSSLDVSSDSGSITVREVAVPEPATILLLGSGLLGIGYLRRKIS